MNSPQKAKIKKGDWLRGVSTNENVFNKNTLKIAKIKKKSSFSKIFKKDKNNFERQLLKDSFIKSFPCLNFLHKFHQFYREHQFHFAICLHENVYWKVKIFWRNALHIFLSSLKLRAMSKRRCDSSKRVQSHMLAVWRQSLCDIFVTIYSDSMMSLFIVQTLKSKHCQHFLRLCCE